MDGLMEMDRWVCLGMDGCLAMDEWMEGVSWDGQMDGRVDGWMDRLVCLGMDGWMDGWMGVSGDG